MGFGSKSSAPAAAPAPTFTQVEQKPAEPINRAATNAEARDRAASNASANLLSPTTTEEQQRAAALMGSTG